MKRQHLFGTVILCAVLTALLLALPGAALAQSLQGARTIFVIGDHNGAFSWPLRAFNVQDNTLVVAETWRPLSRQSGPTGLAVDPYNEHLFVSYEASSIVDVFDATDATPQGQISLAGTADLCGMDIHEGRGTYYVIDRRMNTVFVFDTDTFAPIETWTIVSSGFAGGWDLKIVEGLQGRDVLFVSDATQVVRWFDIDTHEEVGSVTQHTSNALGIAVYVKPDGNPIIFSATLDPLLAEPVDSPFLVKLDVNEATEETANLSGTGRGLDVDQFNATLYVTVGDVGLGHQPHVSMYDVNSFTEITRGNLNAAWSPCDVKATWLAFGSTVKKECAAVSYTDPGTPDDDATDDTAADDTAADDDTANPADCSDGNINMTQYVTFNITVRNKYSRPIHILPLKDQYDTTQLSFVRAVPPTDDNVNDGEVGWADLIPAIGHDLAYLEEYTVKLIFQATPQNCTSGNVAGENLGVMTGAQDDRGTVLDDSSGSFAYKVWCNCVTDEDCDNGVWCDGAEHCVNRQCKSDGNPCPADDGVWCNGSETITCIEATHECGHSGDPCAGQQLDQCSPVTCDEATQSCLAGDDPCPDDGQFCNGTESCVPNKVDCQHSGNPCEQGEQCDEVKDECVPFNIDDDSEPQGDDTVEKGWPEGKVTGGCCGCS